MDISQKYFLEEGKTLEILSMDKENKEQHSVKLKMNDLLLVYPLEKQQNSNKEWAQGIRRKNAWGGGVQNLAYRPKERNAKRIEERET
jgi:hypothetical protein